MSENPLAAWCALWRAPGVGVRTFARLLSAFGSPAAFFETSEAEVRAKLPDVAVEKWRAWRAVYREQAYAADLEWLSGGDDRHILTLEDPAYPPLLKEIPDPPPLLFVQGDLTTLPAGQVAVVGSRQVTPGGRACAAGIVGALAAQGLVITSGLALGADGMAHENALQAGGRSVAVVATGLDRVYPARHRALAHRIAGNGALVSEFPIATGVRQTHFPRRNRIISGLSLGVFVVEASRQSGSLITARHAVEQGREVFAMPGSVHNPLVRGCHELICQGAKLVERAEDILEELLPLAQAGLDLYAADPPADEGGTAPEQDGESGEEMVLLEAIGYDPCRVDDLVERTRLTSERISAMLLVLELDGRVARLPGGFFQRTLDRRKGK